MRVSVDGGAISRSVTTRSGNYTFSENLIKAIKKYDKSNSYTIYNFDNLKPRLFWLKIRVSWQELLSSNSIFLGLNQAIPLYTGGKKIIFCHGLSYYFFPGLYNQKDVIKFKRQLYEMIHLSDQIIVTSIKVKKELLKINSKISDNIQVIMPGIPFDMLSAKKTKKKKYFLLVANNQPIKNIKLAVSSFIKSNLFKSGYTLKLVGKWEDQQNIDQGIVSLGNVNRDQLRQLYQQATALLTTSFYESFNFPVIEALSQNCPVIGVKSSIIDELEPYVNVCNNGIEFTKMLVDITNNKFKKINRHQLIKEFSWSDYVNTLTKLY